MDVTLFETTTFVPTHLVSLQGSFHERIKERPTTPIRHNDGVTDSTTAANGGTEECMPIHDGNV